MTSRYTCPCVQQLAVLGHRRRRGAIRHFLPKCYCDSPDRTTFRKHHSSVRDGQVGPLCRYQLRQTGYLIGTYHVCFYCGGRMHAWCGAPATEDDIDSQRLCSSCAAQRHTRPKQIRTASSQVIKSGLVSPGKEKRVADKSQSAQGSSETEKYSIKPATVVANPNTHQG